MVAVFERLSVIEHTCILTYKIYMVLFTGYELAFASVEVKGRLYFIEISISVYNRCDCKFVTDHGLYNLIFSFSFHCNGTSYFLFLD